MSLGNPEAPLTPDQRAELLKRAWELLNGKDYRGVVALLEPLPEAELLAEPELGFCLAASWRRVDELGRALQLVETLSSKTRQTSTLLLRCQVENLKGGVLLLAGHLLEAELCLNSALELASDLGKDLYLASTLANLGIIRNIRGDSAAAVALFSRAAEASSRVGNGRELGQIYQSLAIAMRDLEAFDQAHSHFEYAQRILERFGSPDELIGPYCERALLLCHEGDLRLAEGTAQISFARANELQLPRLVGEARRVLGIIAFARGDWAEAREQLSAALDGSRATSNPLLEAEVLEELAVLEQAEGNEPRADEALEHSCRIYERMGAPQRAQRARARLAPAAVTSGNGTEDPLFD